MIHLLGKDFIPLTIKQQSGMVGPTMYMAWGDPSKAAVFLKRTKKLSNATK